VQPKRGRALTEAEQNRLIGENMGLVPTIAADFRGMDVDFEDLLAAGREGLVNAARSFDPSRSRFSTWAGTKIRSAIMDSVRTKPSEWYPKDGAFPPLESDKIERIYQHDSWGEFGNAAAICETWSKLGTSPEDLSLLYDDLKDKKDKFSAAFISLSGSQRKLVDMVFLWDVPVTVPQAARELGISRFQAGRMLKRALKTMREVITRMEANKRPAMAA